MCEEMQALIQLDLCGKANTGNALILHYKE